MDRETTIVAAPDVTVGEVLLELVRHNFLPYKYTLLIIKKDKSNKRIQADSYEKSLDNYGVSEGDTLQVISAAKVGGGGAQICQPFQQADIQPNQEIARNGIVMSSLKLIDSDELLKNVEDPTALKMLLHEFRVTLAENNHNNQMREIENQKILVHRDKLIDEVNEYKIKLSDKKTAAVALFVAEVVIGLGMSFVTVNPIPSIATVIAGIVLSIYGLWLSFKKG